MRHARLSIPGPSPRADWSVWSVTDGREGHRMWDPVTYLRFGDERGRPFFDLVGRITTSDPVEVVDLGCGPGTLTIHLARRWPGARVRGIDSSAEMIESARGLGSTVEFDIADVRDWQAGSDTGLVV